MNLHLPIDQSNPLIPLHAPHSIESPVFCIPGAGASVTSFVEFVNALDKECPIYGLQPRGINIKRTASCKCGRSRSGLVAFDMALRLHEQGKSVASLTLIDTDPPDSIGEAPRQVSTAEIFREFTEAFEDIFDKSLDIDRAVIASGQARVFVDELNAALIKTKVLPLRNHVSMLQGSLATFTAAFNSRYVPSRCYANTLRLVLVGPRSNRRVSMDDVRKKWDSMPPNGVNMRPQSISGMGPDTISPSCRRPTFTYSQNGGSKRCHRLSQSRLIRPGKRKLTSKPVAWVQLHIFQEICQQ